MDPLTNIEQQREIAGRINDLRDSDPMSEDEQTEMIDLGFQLAELVAALDEWRRRGGFDPYSESTRERWAL